EVSVVVAELEKEAVAFAKILVQPHVKLIRALLNGRIEYEVARRRSRRRGRQGRHHFPGCRVEPVYWNPVPRKWRALVPRNILRIVNGEPGIRKIPCGHPRPLRQSRTRG